MTPAPSHGRTRRRLLPLAALLLALLPGCAGDDAGTAAPGGNAADDAARTTTSAAAGDPEAAGEPEAEPQPADERSWPGETWPTATPAEAGMDEVALAEMAAAAERAGSQCLVVTRGGELVGEWYWDGFGPETERETFSVTKSITSTLVGIAQDRGLLDIDDPASRYIEEWRGTPSEDVTIRNLLANDSGRFQDFPTDYVRMAVEADDKTAFSIGLSQQHPPGTEWVYNNAAIQTLEAVLEEATGEPVGAFAEAALFEPVGMSSSIKTDAAGNTLTFMGAEASCRDLARFGLLFQRGGEWDGEQVVSEAWVREATSPSQTLNPGYGYLWWLDRSGGTGTGDGTGEAIAPEGGGGTYAALGLHNQLLGVFPDDEVVATRLGADRGEDGSAFGLGELAAGIDAAVGDDGAAADGNSG